MWKLLKRFYQRKKERPDTWLSGTTYMSWVKMEAVPVFIACVFCFTHRICSLALRPLFSAALVILTPLRGYFDSDT